MAFTETIESGVCVCVRCVEAAAVFEWLRKGVTAFRLTPRAPECHSERVYTGAGSQMHRNVMALDANAKANTVAWESERHRR